MNIAFHHLLINQSGRAHSPPLGVLTLVQILKNQQYPCSFHQYLHVRGTILDPNQLARQILDQPGVAAVSTMINGLPLLVLALRIVKKEDPEKVIIVGGPGMTGIAYEVISMFPEIDMVAYGEGDSQIVQIAEWIHKKRKPEDIAGVCFRQDGEVIKTDQAARIQDLDQIPLMDLSEIDLDDYGGFPVMSSRGCPFKCSFCDVAPSWGRKNTRRSVEHVLDELDYLYEHVGIRSVAFVDDLFIINRAWVEDFCKQKIERGNQMIWRANGHINLATEELVSIMAEAGCESMFYGVESGSDEVLDKIVKNFTIKKAVEVLQMTSRYMITNLNLIWAYPFESTWDLRETLKYHEFFKEKELRCSLVMLAPLQSAPITDEYEDLVLEFKYPNIFLLDYYELSAKFGLEFEQLLMSNSKVFSAFYSFNSDLLPQHVALVEDYQHYASQKGEVLATPRELWQSL